MLLKPDINREVKYPERSYEGVGARRWIIAVVSHGYVAGSASKMGDYISVLTSPKLLVSVMPNPMRSLAVGLGAL